MQALRSQKAAWDTYLRAAYSVGLFEGSGANDLYARLTGTDDDNFRSAMAECLAAWFLAGPLRLKVSARPLGRPGHPLELAIHLNAGDVHAEVKAPHRPVRNQTFWGDDSDLLKKSLEDANRQFSAESANLLIVVPELRIPLSSMRGQLTRALFGDLRIVIPIDTRTGGPAGPDRLEYEPTGHFVATHRPGGRAFKPSGEPRFTRVGGVLTIEEFPTLSVVDHRALVVHNPHATRQLREDIWAEIRQFVPRDGEMIWTDGASPWQ